MGQRALRRVHRPALGVGPLRVRRRRWLVAALAAAALLLSWYLVHQAMPGWYARLWYPLDYRSAIRTEASRNGLDPSLVAGIIYKESKFDAGSRSPQGAVGLMQVLPRTARFVASRSDPPAASPERIRDPAANIAYGTRYLRYLLGRYGNEEIALAAYNAGETNVDGWMRAASAEGRGLQFPRDIPFPETRDFVRGVEHTRAIYRRTYRSELALGGS